MYAPPGSRPAPSGPTSAKEPDHLPVSSPAIARPAINIINATLFIRNRPSFGLCYIRNSRTRGSLRFFEALGAGPIEADLVTVGIIQVGVHPAPRHQGGRLGEFRARSFELFAEGFKVANFEVEPYAIGGERFSGLEQMQGDGRSSGRGFEARIDNLRTSAKLFDEFETQEVAIEAERSPDILRVDHGVVEIEPESRHGDRIQERITGG